MSKRKHSVKRKHAQGNPPVLAWVLLIAAWITVFAFAWYVFVTIHEEKTDPTEQVAAVFHEQTEDLSIEQIPFKASIKRFSAVNSLRSDRPTILIYHTHTTEAYTQTEQDRYTESSKWRTNDETKNIVAVGETLKEILERDYGFTVIHDTTNHEPPKLATAYERSLLTMERYHAEYPSIVLFIDLHRDAYDTEKAPCDYLTIDGTETARLMLVVGKGEKYSDKPYFESNAAFAQRITNHLNSIAPNLCRPVRMKSGRYNQHVSPNSILVEVGHNANTLSQAKASMKYLAESIAYAFVPDGIAPCDWMPN